MLVEDSPDDVMLIQRVFKKNNIDVDFIVAIDGAEALNYLFGKKDYPGKSDNALPSLILLDLKIPKVNGIEILEWVRKENKTRLIPVVIITSSKEEKDVIMGYNSGANSYIKKPIIYEEFSDVIRMVGYYWLNLNEPMPC